MFEHIKVGDTVTRNFYGLLQRMKVTEVTPHLIVAGLGWMFDRETGVEEDPDLGFGVAFGVTCSNLVQTAGDIDAQKGKQIVGTAAPSTSQETSPTGEYVQCSQGIVVILSTTRLSDGD